MDKLDILTMISIIAIAVLVGNIGFVAVVHATSSNPHSSDPDDIKFLFLTN